MDSKKSKKKNKNKKQTQQYQNFIEQAQPSNQQQQRQVQQQDNSMNDIQQMIAKVDPDAPLPDFSNIEENSQILRNLIEDMETTIELIEKEQYDKLPLQEIKKQQEQQQQQNIQQMIQDPELSKKRDQMIKDVGARADYFSKEKEKLQKMHQNGEQDGIKPEVQQLMLAVCNNLEQDRIRTKELLSSVM